MPDPLRLRYSERAHRFVDNRGRFVSSATVRGWLDVALDREAQAVAALAADLQAGRVDLITWELAMRQRVKSVAIYSATLAKGGRAQLTAADLGRVGAAVREQYGYLDAFARQIEAGLPLDGRFTRRTQMYAQSGRGLYHRTERGEMARRGYTEERNQRHARDSCDGCVAASAAGWVPIGTLAPIGTRTCLSNCRCTIAYRTAAQAAQEAA